MPIRNAELMGDNTSQLLYRPFADVHPLPAAIAEVFFDARSDRWEGLHRLAAGTSNGDSQGVGFQILCRQLLSGSLVAVMGAQHGSIGIRWSVAIRHPQRQIPHSRVTRAAIAAEDATKIGG